MADYNDPQAVADLLSQFDFTVLHEQAGDFPSYRKFTCEFSKPGIESFVTGYPSDRVPTAADVFSAMTSDASMVAHRHIDDFAATLDFEKPSQIIRAYESAHTTLDWLRNSMQLAIYDISVIAETLNTQKDYIDEEVNRVQSERKAEREFAHPPVPDGFTAIGDLQENLDLGALGDMIDGYTGELQQALYDIAETAVYSSKNDPFKWLADNREWLGYAQANDYIEHEVDLSDFTDVVESAQRYCYECNLREHKEDIAKYAALEGLKDAGVYALADGVYDDVFDGITVNFNDESMNIEDFASEAQAAIQDAMDAPIYEAIGSNDEIMEDGKLHGDYEAIKASGYDFPNPCAMSAGAVRAVNEMGYDAAFSEFWKDFMQDGRDASATQEVTLIPVTLHFNDTPGISESATFSVQDTEGLDLDDKVLFSGLSHEELTEMVGKQTGEDFTIESVGEPYQVKASAKDKPSLSEVANETRDSSSALESRAESAEPSPEKKHPEH